MTPLINVLRCLYPAAELDVLVYEETKSVLLHYPHIRNLWGVKRAISWWKQLWHWLCLYFRLAARRYDWVLHLSDQWNGALLAWILRPQEAVGFDYPKRRNYYWQRCFSRLAPCAPSNSLHAVEQNLLCVEPFGLNLSQYDKRCTMAVSAEDYAVVKRYLAQLGVATPYIVVHPAARWLFKCWEDERFAAVIQALADNGWPVIVTAAPIEQEMHLVANVLAKVHSPQVYSLAGQLSLNSLAALIDGARLLIGVDSVPMHMAAALQTDCVALFGPSKLNEWRPWCHRHLIVNAADYGVIPDADAVDSQTTERYLSAIPSAAVLDAVYKMLLPDEQRSRG